MITLSLLSILWTIIKVALGLVLLVLSVAFIIAYNSSKDFYGFTASSASSAKNTDVTMDEIVEELEKPVEENPDFVEGYVGGLEIVTE